MKFGSKIEGNKINQTMPEDCEQNHHDKWRRRVSLSNNYQVWGLSDARFQ